MAGNRALRRACEMKAVIRINSELPNITDATELITPEIAQELLQRNKKNRPLNWATVEKFSKAILDDDFPLHPQGIIIDSEGSIVTGQHRLWAVINANKAVYMRVSRGTPPDTARYIDRHRPQSARDLATRETEKKHTPNEASLARARLALKEVLRPTADQIADMIVKNAEAADRVLKATHRTKKTKAVLMILAAICATNDLDRIEKECERVEMLALQLDEKLQPMGADKSWNKGAAFEFAMAQAVELVQRGLRRVV